MSISQLAREIKESPTLRLNEEAMLLKERGEPVINMTAGEPKNKAPITAILGSAAKLTDGEVKYTPVDGTRSLKKAIIRYTEENYGRMPAPENVIVSTGAKQSLFNLLFSIVNPQDEVVVLAPYWVSYPEIIKMCHGIPVIVSAEDGSFCPRFDEIEQAVSSYTRAIIVNSPNNPSGVVFPEDLIAALVDFCEGKSIYLIMDDIYQKLVFDGRRAPVAYHYTDRDFETTHVIVINGVSKLYGMTGFRIGWAIANRRLVEVMANVQGQVTSSPPMISQSAAEGALTGMQSVTENLRLFIQNNRDVLVNELSTFTDVRFHKPEGTFYCLPDFRAYGSSSVELTRFLLDKALVVTVPGVEFGMEGHIRISFSGTVKEITEAVRRMKWALDPNAPNDIYIGDRRLIRDWM
jgi:aspartate aminotransferase